MAKSIKMHNLYVQMNGTAIRFTMFGETKFNVHVINQPEVKTGKFLLKEECSVLVDDKIVKTFWAYNDKRFVKLNDAIKYIINTLNKDQIQKTPITLQDGGAHFIIVQNGKTMCVVIAGDIKQAKQYAKEQKYGAGVWVAPLYIGGVNA